MTKCSVAIVRKWSAGSYRLWARTDVAAVSSNRANSALRSARLIRSRRSAEDIFQEQQIGAWGQLHPVQRALGNHEVHFVPETDVRHVDRHATLDFLEELEPMSFIEGRGRFIEERVDPRVAEMPAVESCRWR